MKTNTSNLTLALNLARVTQQAYNMLKSPKTQRIRNPFPMRVLVKLVLPTLKARETVNVLKTMTADEVVDALRSKGFVVYPPSIKSVLSQSRASGEICAARSHFTMPIGRRPFLYFQRQTVNA
jgi:hypothetical protein